MQEIERNCVEELTNYRGRRGALKSHHNKFLDLEIGNFLTTNILVFCVSFVLKNYFLRMTS